MELKVKNLASSDSRGYDLQKEVMVKVTHQRTREVTRPWGRGFGSTFPGTEVSSIPTACGDPEKGHHVFQV